jgi:protein-disulfide isomerase
VITVLVGVIGITLVGGLLVLQGGGTQTGSTGPALTAPLVATPIDLAADRSLGQADAPVTLELWTDFQCPICGQFARTVEPALISKYVTTGTLRIVHHDAAFQGAKSGAAYDESVEAAAGARCAAVQGRYWPFQDWTFANQSGENEGAFAAARLTAIATAAGLDTGAWQACVTTGDQQRAARAETSQALAAGVNATPTLRINDQVVVGLRSVTDISKMIDAAATAAARG